MIRCTKTSLFHVHDKKYYGRLNPIEENLRIYKVLPDSGREKFGRIYVDARKAGRDSKFPYHR